MGRLRDPEKDTQIINMVAAGATNGEIAEELGLKVGTISHNISRIRKAGRLPDCKRPRKKPEYHPVKKRTSIHIPVRPASTDLSDKMLGLKPTICSVCGKQFYSGAEWGYKTEKNKKVCSWSCKRQDEREKEQKKAPAVLEYRRG